MPSVTRILASLQPKRDCSRRKFGKWVILEIKSTSATVAIELMVGNTTAAHPLPPRRSFFKKSRRQEGGRAYARGIGFFCFRGLLFRRDQGSDFYRRYSQEIFIDQAGARHIAIERWTTFAEKIFYFQFTAQDVHSAGQINQIFFSGDDDTGGRTSLLQPRSSCIRGDDEAIHRIAVKNTEIARIKGHSAGYKDVLLALAAQLAAQAKQHGVVNPVHWAAIAGQPG